MKRILGILLTATLLLAGCTGGLSPLDVGFDEAQVKGTAAGVVALANGGDYEGIWTRMREDVQEQISASELEKAWAGMLTAVGDFVEIANTRCFGATDSATGDAYAVAVVTCRYAHGQRVFTLSFDGEMALVGLYLK